MKHLSERLIRTAGATALIAGVGLAGATSASAYEALPDNGASAPAQSPSDIHEVAMPKLVDSFDNAGAYGPDEVKYFRGGCAVTQRYINDKVCAEYGELDPVDEALNMLAK